MPFEVNYYVLFKHDFNMNPVLDFLAMSYLSFPFQEKPYNKDDDVMKATSFEVISTLREVLRTSSLWKDHVQTYTQVRLFNTSFFFSLLHIYVFNHLLKVGIV